MRTFRFLNIAILSALLASAALLYAQDDKQQDNHPAQDQARPDDAGRPPADAKPARPDAANPPKQDERQDQMHPQATPERADHPEQPAPKAEPTPNRQMGNAGDDHAANGRGGRIPDKQFHAHFGQQHHFRAQGVIVAGQPRFQYGGYSFQLVQAWPAGWAYTDDCYIDFIDGQYFLIDLSHPGIEIPLIVIL
ncbi:MAG TPA: hypothetical protein VMF10_07155 [Candidatus Aquilonibacter sp.]|nr:hypothetical protein [Candidatus Aquilonibacter sp.]